MKTVKLYVETITGGRFELNVLPEDTIESVKTKISRIEGIPVSQQQLVHNDKELSDDKLVADYPNLFPSAKLRLMVVMRGGPINTRRITLDDSTSLTRDMADYLETHEELLDRFSGSRHPVTLVVFRDGDQFSFFRVVDKADGTLSPYSSDSLSAESGLADDQDNESIKLDDENETTKEKVKQLKQKMEQLSIQKTKPLNEIKAPSYSVANSYMNDYNNGHVASTNYSKISLSNPPVTNPAIPKPPLTPSANKNGFSKSRIRTLKPSPSVLSSKNNYNFSRSSSTLPPLMHLNVAPESYNTDDKVASSTSIRETTKDITAPKSVLDSVKEEKNHIFTNSANSRINRKTSASIYLESLSHNEAKGLLRQASIERIGSSLEKLDSSSITSFNYTPIPPSTKLSSHQMRYTPDRIYSSKKLRTSSGLTTGRILSPKIHLPPVEHKKKSKRCFVCTKKLGLANSFHCKCSNCFCAIHRYAESHNCPFDYKNEGRKLLEKNNPLVRAPKLPKI